MSLYAQCFWVFMIAGGLGSMLIGLAVEGRRK